MREASSMMSLKDMLILGRVSVIRVSSAVL